MSVYSVDHAAPISDDGYKGYTIEDDGQVLEFYDHTNESEVHAGPSSGISGSRRLLAEPPAPPPEQQRRPRAREVQRTAGCCASCVGCLITIGRLPIGSAACMLLIWLGTGMFMGAGFAVLSETMDLYDRYGPVQGNPAKDPRPEYFLISGGSSVDQRYELRNPEDLGNRVPEVFDGIRRSFYGIIPLMFIFSLMVVVDGAQSTKEIHTRERGCKSTSSGVCCSLFIMFGSYILLLAWIFWLCFTTLGVYYYRIVMLRCDDLYNRGFTDGVRKDVCLDLVQFGVIMFKNTNDEYFGKICGPGDDSRRTVGQLEEYCDNYKHAWQLMLVCFAGCFINVIAMVHSLMLVTGNYHKLQSKYLRPIRTRQAMTNASSYSPANSRRTVAQSNLGGPPSYVVATNGRGDNRRGSRDIELEYRGMEPEESSVASYLPPPRKRFEKDSNVGVDYYYKRY